ncbi:hypothetical protein ACVUCS_002976 [Salmonella enterica subsp. enterica]
MKKTFLIALMAFSLHAQATNLHGINICDTSIAIQEYDSNGDEKGVPVAKETIKNGATIAFKEGAVDVTIPWNYQEKKDPELFTRELDIKMENDSWGSEDSRLLKKYNNGFLYIDGPGINRSVFLIFNCKS